jgi:hypothetical protein
MSGQSNGFVAGYTYNFPNGPEFVPVFEGSFIKMFRIKQKCQSLDLHGNRIIKGCPWDVRRADEVKVSQTLIGARQ